MQEKIEKRISNLRTLLALAKVDRLKDINEGHETAAAFCDGVIGRVEFEISFLSELLALI